MSEIGEKCSHGKRWDEECPECNLVAARELIHHWGGKVAEARALIADAERQAVRKGNAERVDRG